MPRYPEILAHHSEPIDPALWEWLRVKIDHVLGLSPGVLMILLGTVIVLFPVIVMALLWRKRRNG
ncbi:MAG: hypothetical protein HQ477_08370 [Chloroflexi bacterium]|nr:hypothetical protein [Chloroflexota bacterium]